MNTKVPKFLNTSNNIKHKTEKSNNSKTENKGKIILPIKQTFSNKILTNFQFKNKDKSEEGIQKNDKSKSRSIKKVSPEINPQYYKDPSLKSTMGSQQRKKNPYQVKNPSYHTKAKGK